MSAPVLVGDVGGTNARFALATLDPAGGAVLHEEARLRVADHAAPADAIRAYLAGVSAPIPLHACLAVAGPTDGQEVRLTHAPWRFDARTAEQAGLASLRLVNDWAAAALGAARAPQSSAAVLDAVAVHTAPVAALGPGTGLGLGYAMPLGEGGWRAVASEGGHAPFAPKDPLEAEIAARLAEAHPHVSFERIVSGPGLAAVHQALGEIEGLPAPPLSPREVTNAALDGDARARHAVSILHAGLASFAQTAALTIGARGGVYLGGGVLARTAELFDADAFAARFREAGPMSAYLAAIPVRRLTDTATTALIGAALLAG